MRMRAGTETRSGFTLVEILIVVAIIATLAALLLGAINRVGDVGRKAVAGSEISQLETAVAKFKVDNGFAPPTWFILPGTTTGPTPTSIYSSDPAIATRQQSCERYLEKMFRGYVPTTHNQIINFRGKAAAPVNPNAVKNPSAVAAPGYDGLVGIESLAFFLGGPSLTGFQPNIPIAPTGTSVKGPYYTFDVRRFTDPDTKTDTTQYRDPWQTPYVMFSAGSGKDYSVNDAYIVPLRDTALIGPFRISGGAWGAPGQLQIISAGPDQEFGTPYTSSSPGGPKSIRGEWQPGVGEYADTATESFGADDISNFNNGVPLGTASK